MTQQQLPPLLGVELSVRNKPAILVPYNTVRRQHSACLALCQLVETLIFLVSFYWKVFALNQTRETGWK